MEEESDDKSQVNESDSESTHEDELESRSESSKQSRPSIQSENELQLSSDEAEHEAIFNQIKSKYSNKKRSKTPSPISTRSNSKSSERRSKTPSISSHRSMNSSNSVPVFDRLYAESYALRKKREEEIKNKEDSEMQKYSSKKRSTSTPVRANSVYSPTKIKQHYQEREIYQKEQQLKAEEEKKNNEIWLCPICSYSNKMKDKMCMNPMKGGTVKVTIQNLKKCKSQQMEEVLVCGCKQPKLGTPFICKRSKDLMNTPGQNTFQSLYEDSVCRKDRREVLQKADDERLNKVYTYTPTLNKHSVNIVNKKGDRDKNIGEYLYKQFQLKLKNSNNLELENKSTTSSSKTSRLHPYTNETQKEFCDRLYRDGERKELLRKMKESEALQYDEDGHKLFQPHITREPLIINRDPDLDIYTYLHALSYTQNQKLQLLKENYEDEEKYEINSGKMKNNHTDKVTKKKSEWFFKKVFSIMIDSETFDNFDEVIIDKSVIEKDYSIFRDECQNILKNFFIRNLNKKYTFLPFSHSLYKYIVTSTGGRFAFVIAPQAKVNIPSEFDEKEMLFSPKINIRSHQILKNSEHYNNNNNNNQSIYTTLYEDHINHQKRLEHLKELYLSQQCEEYTFQPQVGRKPQYDVNNTTTTTTRTSLSANSSKDIKRSTPMKVDYSIYKEEEFDDYDNDE